MDSLKGTQFLYVDSKGRVWDAFVADINHESDITIHIIDKEEAYKKHICNKIGEAICINSKHKSSIESNYKASIEEMFSWICNSIKQGKLDGEELDKTFLKKESIARDMVPCAFR
jgi:hypothetical protein